MNAKFQRGGTFCGYCDLTIPSNLGQHWEGEAFKSGVLREQLWGTQVTWRKFFFFFFFFFFFNTSFLFFLFFSLDVIHFCYWHITWINYDIWITVKTTTYVLVLHTYVLHIIDSPAILTHFAVRLGDGTVFTLRALEGLVGTTLHWASEEGFARVTRHPSEVHASGRVTTHATTFIFLRFFLCLFFLSLLTPFLFICHHIRLGTRFLNG